MSSLARGAGALGAAAVAEPHGAAVAVGDRVAWSMTAGLHAGLVVADSTRLLPVPGDVDLETACAATLQGMTAHALVTDCVRVQEGTVAVVHAAAGGVGQLLTQMITNRGGTVIATAGSDTKLEIARSRGASEVIDYGQSEDLAADIAAREAGIKVKINAVALRGVNEDEIADMIAWAHGDGMDMTLIEVMPLGEIEGDRTDQFLPLSVARARLESRYTLTPLPDRTGGPARYFTIKETGQRLGFITPMTHNFCESCNRVRLTCTGTPSSCRRRARVLTVTRFTPSRSPSWSPVCGWSVRRARSRAGIPGSSTAPAGRGASVRCVSYTLR